MKTEDRSAWTQRTGAPGHRERREGTRPADKKRRASISSYPGSIISRLRWSKVRLDGFETLVHFLNQML
jgi:hypothetical protein